MTLVVLRTYGPASHPRLPVAQARPAGGVQKWLSELVQKAGVRNVTAPLINQQVAFKQRDVAAMRANAECSKCNFLLATLSSPK